MGAAGIGAAIGAMALPALVNEHLPGGAFDLYNDLAKLTARRAYVACAYCDAERPHDDSRCKNCGAREVAKSEP